MRTPELQRIRVNDAFIYQTIVALVLYSTFKAPCFFLWICIVGFGASEQSQSENSLYFLRTTFVLRRDTQVSQPTNECKTAVSEAAPPPRSPHSTA